MSNWTLCDPALFRLFGTLEQAVNCAGTEINGNWMSRLVLLEDGESSYYVKVYFGRGRGLRSWIGRSRVRAEWENLALFSRLGVSTAELVAFGECTDSGYQGALVTKAVTGTRDLAALESEKNRLLADRGWCDVVIRRLSASVRRLHNEGFIHNDLKWRNILVGKGDDPEVFIIDCPMGRKLWGPLLSRGKIKDLACLDKVGKYALRRTQRLRFYLQYRNQDRLGKANKKEIRKILAFFDGRE